MNELEEIDWKAIRYVMADLNAAEAKRFEQQLEEDQRAREAVAKAVEMARSIAAIESQCNARARRSIPLQEDDRHPWRAATTWIAIGTALCITIAVAMIRLPSPDSALTQSAPWHAPTVGQLAITWSETHDALKTPLWPSEQSEQLDANTTQVRIAEGDLDLVDIELTANDDSESWIHQAVVGLIQQTDDGDEDLMKEL